MQLLSGCFLSNVGIDKHTTLKAFPTRDTNHTLTSFSLHSDVPPDVTDLLRPPHSLFFFFSLHISNVTCIFFFSPLSLETAGIISCASMQSCQIFPLALFFGSVYSWDKLSRPPLFFFVLNSKHLNGFWRRGSVRGRGDKEAFSWDAFTSKFLSERVTVIHVDSDSLWKIKGGRLRIHSLRRLNA